MNPFTRFYAAIKTDCHAYGNKFNAALHKVIVDCHNRTTKVKRQCSSKDSVAFPIQFAILEGALNMKPDRYHEEEQVRRTLMLRACTMS